MRADPIHTGLWGRTQSGKSTRLRILLKAESRCWVALDPLRQFAGMASDQVTTMDGVLGAIDRGWRRGFGISYQPGPSVDLVDALDKVSRLLFQVMEPYQKGADLPHLHLALDEAADCAPLALSPKHSFHRLCRQGRHFGIGIYGASQKLASVTTSFRGNTDRDFFFPLRAAVDYEAARQLIGRAHTDTLRGLQPHSALLYQGGRGEVVRNPPL